MVKAVVLGAAGEPSFVYDLQDGLGAPQEGENASGMHRDAGRDADAGGFSHPSRLRHQAESASLFHFCSRSTRMSPRHVFSFRSGPCDLATAESIASFGQLALYDIVATPGVAADLSHIATPAKVKGYLPKDENALEKTLTGADIVVIPAGVPRKPGMTRDDLFKINAGICQGLAEGIAKYSPKAFVLVISNPVNSTVPIFAEVLKKAGVFDPKRVFGVTTLDVVRASTFVAEILDDLSLAPTVTVPVVGGHSGVTIIPLLSQSQPPLPSSVTQENIEALTKRIQYGGDEVVKAKDGAGSATLSMAQAGYQFANLIIEAIKGKKGIVTPSYVNLAADTAGGEAVKKELGADLEYFSVPVELGPNGVEKIRPLGNLNDYEQGLVKAALSELGTNIGNGVSFVAGPKL